MSGSVEQNEARTFEAHRSALTGLAYRMLGGALRGRGRRAGRLPALRRQRSRGATRGYLGTVVTRLCLDRIKSAQARRELYVGQWLPEPVVDETMTTVPPAIWRTTFRSR